VRIIALKSSLVNSSGASLPRNEGSRGTLWSRNLSVVSHEKSVSVPFDDVDPDGVILRAVQPGFWTAD
jgi:hypothetical protein